MASEMAETVKVMTLEGEELELRREDCTFIDRSRIAETGYDCSYKRWLQYEWGGQGIERVKQNEDAVLGIAAHQGLEGMLSLAYAERWGLASLTPEYVWELSWAAGETARGAFLDEAQGGLVMQWDEAFEEIMPETAGRLVEEQAVLAQALVVAFGLRHLAGFYQQYELVATEPEILWLLGRDPAKGKWFVMMSRPDAVVRDRITRKLFVVSYKTTQKIDELTHLKMEVDPQGLTEMMAVKAWLREPVEGVIYYFFQKGKKEFDKEWQAKRFGSPLIRPWRSLQLMGPMSPAQFAARYEWWDQDPAGGWHKHTLGKYWKRVEAYREPGLEQWLEWLHQGLVQPGMGIDWLQQAVADPMPVLRSESEQEQWRRTTLRAEIKRLSDIEQVSHLLLTPEDAFERRTTACFDWQHTCPWFEICHRGETVGEGLANGRLRPRTPNHPAELGQGEVVEDLVRARLEEERDGAWT